MEFLLRKADDETEQCDSCNLPVPTAEFEWGPPYTAVRPRAKRLVCDFCCTTMASRYTEYPSLHEFSQVRAEIWRAAAGVFHMVKGDIDG